MRMFKVLLLILMLSPVCFAAGDVEFPKAAGAGYVNDFAQVIDPGTRSDILQLLTSLEKKTSVEIAVVTLATTAPLDSKSYAVELFNKWGLGKKGYDNGALILFVKDDKRIEVEVGYGLEDILTDGYIGRTLDENAIPFFKKGKYAEGLYMLSTII